MLKKTRTYSRKRDLEGKILEGAEDVCRLCLGQPKEAVPIFTQINDYGITLATRITTCVGLPMKQEDCLPNQICSECHSELDRCYRFRKKCEASYQRLKSHLFAVQDAKSMEKNINSDTNNSLTLGSIRDECKVAKSSKFVKSETEINCSDGLFEHTECNRENPSYFVTVRDNGTKYLVKLEESRPINVNMSTEKISNRSENGKNYLTNRKDAANIRTFQAVSKITQPPELPKTLLNQPRVPSSSIQSPLSTIQTPTSSIQTPLSSIQTPLSSIQTSSSSMHAPIFSKLSPLSSKQDPLSSNQYPQSSIPTPSSSMQASLFSSQSSQSSIQTPCSSIRAPLFSNQSTLSRASSIQTLASSFQAPLFSNQSLLSSTQTQAPLSSNQSPPGIQTPLSSIQTPLPSIQSPQTSLSNLLTTVLVAVGAVERQSSGLLVLDGELREIELTLGDGTQLVMDLEEEDTGNEEPTTITTHSQEESTPTPTSTAFIEYNKLAIGNTNTSIKEELAESARVERYQAWVELNPITCPRPCLRPCSRTCSTCARTFASSSVRARHEREVHARVRPHACDTCGRAFSQKAGLLRHQLLHEGRRPFLCECGAQFRQRSAMLAHAATHADDPPYRDCPYQLCDKRFRHASGLSRHMKWHEGRRFVCADCGRVFDDKSALRRHFYSDKHKQRMGKGAVQTASCQQMIVPEIIMTESDNKTEKG